MDDQHVKQLLRKAAEEVPVTNASHVEKIRIAARGGRRRQPKRHLALRLAAGSVLIFALLLLPNRQPPDPPLPPAPPALSQPQYVPNIRLPMVVSPYPDPLSGIVIWPGDGV